MRLKNFFISVLFISLFIFVLPAAANDNAEVFFSLLDEFEQEELIEGDGETISYGDYSDELPMFNYYRWGPFTEAENFVLSADIAWDSAVERPTFNGSGCGVIFNSKDKGNHLLLTPRADGYVYITGYKDYTSFSYEKYQFGSTSPRGQIHLDLILAGNKAVVYVDGRRIFTNSDLPIYGEKVGFATMSGSNTNFGTKCDYGNIFMYKW